MADPEVTPSEALVASIVDALGDTSLASLVDMANAALGDPAPDISTVSAADRRAIVSVFRGNGTTYFSEKMNPFPAVTSNHNREFFAPASPFKDKLYEGISIMKNALIAKLLEAGAIQSYQEVPTACSDGSGIGLALAVSDGSNVVKLKEKPTPSNLNGTSVIVYYLSDVPNPTQLAFLEAAPDKIATFRQFLYPYAPAGDQVQSLIALVATFSKYLQSLSVLPKETMISYANVAGSSFRVQGGVDAIPGFVSAGQTTYQYDIDLANRRARALVVVLCSLMGIEAQNLAKTAKPEFILASNKMRSLSGSSLGNIKPLPGISHRNPDGSLQSPNDFNANPFADVNVVNRNAKVTIPPQSPTDITKIPFLVSLDFLAEANA